MEDGLERRPRAEAQSVQDLVLDVLSGRVRIPTWQRKFKWTRDDAQALLDSIYRGYPVGTLLFWERWVPRQLIKFGEVVVDAAQRSDGREVVDGQQRLTTLIRVLEWRGHKPDPLALFFDPDQRRVELPPRGGAPDHWFPLTEALDGRRVLRWLRTHPDADEAAVIDFGTRVREYQLPAYIVSTEDEQVVRRIFQRTNQRGKQLEESEVFDGRFRGADSSAPQGLRDVSLALTDEGFGAFDDELVRQMMLATRTTDPSKASTDRWQADEATRALADVLETARLVVAFLQRDAGVPHLDLLPYRQPMLALARFFHRHPEPHPRNRVLLVRWLWRGAVGGLHTGATVRTREALAAIDGDEDQSVQRLLATVAGARDRLLAPVGEFSARHARARVALLALWSLHPRHLQTEDLLTPLSLVAVPIGQQAKARTSLGNRLLHPKVKKGLRSLLRPGLAETVLVSHAFERDDLSDIAGGRIEEVVRRRTERIERLTVDLVRRRMRWEETDHPPLRSLIVTDDDDEDEVA